MKQKIKDAVAQINKEYGQGSVLTFDDKNKIKVERIMSGSLALDYALGGGWPKGRIIEIYGPEMSGKTTLALHAIAEVHKQGGVALFIDAEHAFDPLYAEKIGVEVDNPDKFLFSQPMNGDEALEIARKMIRTQEIDLIIFDSVAAMIPKAELMGDVGDAKMGLQARLMSQAMRMLVGDTDRAGTSIIFINQLRDKIGVMFGSPETTTGGKALKFYASIRVDVRRIGYEKGDDNIAIANQTRAKIVKNKTAPPFRQAEFNIVYGGGIDSLTEIIDMSVEANIIDKKGSWFSYGKTKLGQGKDAVKQLLNDNPELLEEINNKLLKIING